MEIHEPRTMEFTLGSETPVKMQIFLRQALIGAHCSDNPFFVATPVVSHASVLSLGSSYQISDLLLSESCGPNTRLFDIGFRYVRLHIYLLAPFCFVLIPRPLDIARA